MSRSMFGVSISAIPAARTAYVNLTLDGEHQGLYLLVESYDDDFVEEHFGHADGNLYEAARRTLAGRNEFSDLRPDRLTRAKREIQGQQAISTIEYSSPTKYSWLSNLLSSTSSKRRDSST